jgi:two-component system cell cycle sensor histidine kinase/response regulator CckA
VYGIVKQSGGHTEVTSEIGVGTSISVYLPAAEGEPESIQHVPEPPKRGTETLLLVEDEVSVRRLTRRALEGHGYEVLEADSPVHAIELAHSFPRAIDMVVSDVVMPGMNGRELVEEVRRLRPETRVLFVSGYDEGAVLGTDQLPDDVFFLPKPFTPSALHRKVREAIDV